MVMQKETLWDKVQNRFPVDEAEQLRRALKKSGSMEDIDYMAIKALSELVDFYKIEARIEMRNYRRWKARESAHLLASALRRQEGDILRRNAQDKVALYLDARRDYQDLVALAISAYQNPANDAGESSPA